MAPMPRLSLPRGAKAFRLLTDAGRAYAVDGAIVRSRLDVEFIGGGHPLWRRYVPAGELWIEQRLRGTDGGCILAHEMIEWLLMRSKGYTYERAHDYANDLEADIRRGILEKERLEGLMDICRVHVRRFFKSGAEPFADGIARAVVKWP